MTATLNERPTSELMMSNLSVYLTMAINYIERTKGGTPCEQLQ